jgi:phosphoribosylglycinamide formyltransferase-1
MNNIAVFASGTGSNFVAIQEAILQNELHANIALLVSDKPHSKAVQRAKDFGIQVLTFTPKDFNSKEEYETIIKQTLDSLNIQLVVLAGYMRLIGSTLLKGYENKIINIHPSLLPLYKGKDAVGQAMKDNAKTTGVTVHYVDSGMDTGNIIKQESLDISQLKTRFEIETNIHKIEHKIYKEVIKQLLEE